MNVIEVNELSHSYGNVRAITDLSLQVAPGELFGLVGPDGAGKSTLFKILVTLLRPDKGNASVLGHDVVSHYRLLRQKIGYMPGRFSLYSDLTVEENLSFFAAVFHTTVKENYSLIAPIYDQLAAFKDRRAGALSGGMKQKLALCCALIHKPEVLFLDEPTTGVDAVSRREFWDMLLSLKQHGLTLMVSTPYMDEAGRCERIALMQDGKVLATDSPAQIPTRFTHPLYSVTTTAKYNTIQALRLAPFTQSCYAFGEELHWAVKAGASAEDLANYVQQVPGVTAFASIKPTIEDTFMALITQTQSHGNSSNGQ